MKDITTIIVVKDNPPHFWETIESIDSFTSEIIIGNIGIDNKLLAKINKNKKMRVINLSPDISYVELVRNELIELAKYDFILYMDPDELFPKSAIKVIEEKIEEFDYFSFPRKNIIFGKWIKNSRWWPDYQLRFFKKGYASWPKEVHAEPIGKGRGFTFYAKPEFAILHYNYDKIDDYLEKAFRYAKAQAGSYIKRKENITLSETVKKSINEFISRFFACEGYKDGAHGFFLALLQMFYYFLVYLYYWEAKKYQKIDEKTLINSTKQFFKSGATDTGYWLIEKELTSKADVLKIKIINKLLKL